MQHRELNITEFKETVRQYYGAHARAMPWRTVESDGTCNAYHILVSEFMLQQTQVSRVIPKFDAFINRFPDIAALAEAKLADVLTVWSGLGYNRRAQYLHETAKTLNVLEVWSAEQLQQCKGIGANTAAAIQVYSYNQPLVFIETNIRSVYIHHYFSDAAGVSDKKLLPLIERTLDRENPRDWYWALMDYGTYLKKTAGNNITRSVHYKKQSRFEGSNRQVRGTIIRLLTRQPSTRTDELRGLVQDDRFEAILLQLHKEGLIEIHGEITKLA